MKYWVNLSKDSFDIVESLNEPKLTGCGNWHGPFETYKEVVHNALSYFTTDKEIAQTNINDLRYTSKKTLLERGLK